jgi:hypothetical protein
MRATISEATSAVKIAAGRADPVLRGADRETLEQRDRETDWRKTEST